MKCAEVVEHLCDYVDGGLPFGTRKKLERHLLECVACAAFLKTYQSIPQLYRKFRDIHIPSTVRTNLRDLVRRHIVQQGGNERPPLTE